MANEYQVYSLNLESLASFPTDVRVSALSLESLASFPTALAIRALGVEVLRSVAEGTAPAGSRRRQPMIGSF
jgi:hypothetical protein